jgi:hypothetical protein
LSLALIKIGVSVIGMGEAFPIMSREEIEKLKTNDEKYIAYRKNERVEIIYQF